MNNIELADSFQKAKSSGQMMVAVWWVEDGKIKLDRFTDKFLTNDFASAVQMLNDNLIEESNAVQTKTPPV